MIVLAVVTGAHGIKGEVRLKLFAEGPESLERHDRLYTGDRPLTLRSIRGVPGGAVARFAEVADRDAAASLRGTELAVPRDALPPLEEDEYYHADLVGLECVGPSGEVLGVVVGVENYGAGDLLDIERPDGKRAMIPFRPGIADLEGDRIVVDPAFLA